MKKLELPTALSQQISQALESIGLSTAHTKELAKAVQRLSDFYIKFPFEPTPWNEKWVKAAYIGYYLPLNYLRARFVTEEANRLGFFEGLTQLVDIGAGLGSGTLAALDLGFQPKDLRLIEQAPEAQALQKDFFGSSFKAHQQTSLERKEITPKSLGLYSYSLTEMNELPSEIFEFEALLLIEPSTQDDGRRLLETRSALIQKGFYAWAPCLHQNDCPLLLHSKTDWCHHKFIPELPDWLKKLTDRLPMHTGNILSLSYLLMRKSEAPEQKGLTRVVGDPLKEKGKSRQLICRSSEREFLSWLKREHKKPEFFSRHDLIEIPENAQKAGNEVRIEKNNPPMLAK